MAFFVPARYRLAFILVIGTLFLVTCRTLFATRGAITQFLHSPSPVSTNRTRLGTDTGDGAGAGAGAGASTETGTGPGSRSSEAVAATIKTLADYLVDYPLSDADFGEMGRRVQILQGWIESHKAMVQHGEVGPAEAVWSNIEAVAQSLFSYLRNPSKPNDRAPLSSRLQTMNPGTRGLVIPTGRHNFRYACHLVGAVRNIFQSSMPIQIVYAGDKDLPEAFRDTVRGLGSDIETLDITEVMDDALLYLSGGGWAIKPFAVLASHFEQVVLLDADAVLVQPPEAIFDGHRGYRDRGALFFHDRLLWQGAFPERHAWWKKEMEHHEPSDTLRASLVYSQTYAEEQDSGLVVLDKARMPVFLGLLHICWQNTLPVRTNWTYKKHYGDKESWWLGLELCSVPYTFEEHYSAIIGELDERGPGQDRVCSFTIAHADEAGKLLWYNGSLLKNKLRSATEFLVPTHWMIDGTWDKGRAKQDVSCMRGASILSVDAHERSIFETTVEQAKKLDDLLTSRGQL